MIQDDLFSALFETEERLPLSVSELNADIKSALEGRFANVWVEGEITNFHSAASGHWYFSLTDGDSLIKAACFKGQNYRIRFKPFDGLQVRVRGRITTYEKRGEYQLLVESLEPVGEGALTVAFEQIKAKLLKEGLFDVSLKRQLPPFPRRIGVVTSPTGAAIQDILTVLERRARSISIVIIPTLVQGENAGYQIAEAIKSANHYNSSLKTDKIDVLIVGRGGGSAEDLWAFNEEQVARAIRSSEIPVISAVGHETDHSIADMAADLRAATPSAAAEIVAMAESEIFSIIERSVSKLSRSIEYKFLQSANDLQSLSMSPVFAEFPSEVRYLRHQVDELMHNSLDLLRTQIKRTDKRLENAIKRLSPIETAGKIAENKRLLSLLEQKQTSLGSKILNQHETELNTVMAKLDTLSPLSVLQRGYSITLDMHGNIIRSNEETKPGDKLRIRVAKGDINAEVVS